MGGDGHAHSRKQLTAHGADSDAHRRLARTGALEDIACVLPVIFQHARKIRVSRAHGGDFGPRRRAERIHALLPIYKITIDHLQGDRRSERLAEAQTREYLDAVCLDLHAAAAPVAVLTACKLRIDRLMRNGQSRRNAVKNRRQCRAVRFAGRHKTQMAHSNPPVVSQISSVLK